MSPQAQQSYNQNIYPDIPQNHTHEAVKNDNKNTPNILAIIGHELRTPLNAILGFSEIIKNEQLGTIQNQNYKSYANDINHAGLYMLNLIDGLLDISRIEHQIANDTNHNIKNIKLENEQAVSVANIAKQCKRLMSAYAKQKNISIDENIPENIPALRADPRAIKQIWLNIIANAIKFSPQEKSIHISVKKTNNDEIQISVTDHGPGFPKGISNLNNPFKQGDHTRNTQQNGTGLGLYIVEKLAKLHNATLTIEQKTKIGAKVTITFPNYRTILNPL